MEGTLTGVEMERRVAILMRFKSLLAEQRQRFRAYLDSPDRHGAESGGTEAPLSRAELEERAVQGIITVRKSVEPMRSLYEAAGGGDIAEISGTLDKLKEEAARRSELSEIERRIASIRAELNGLRNNPFARPAYAEDRATIDIRG